MVGSQPSNSIRNKTVSFNIPLNTSLSPKRKKPTQQRISNTDMQYIMDLPKTQKNKALKYLNQLPQQITSQALNRYIEQYKDTRVLDLTTTELSQKNIVIDDTLKTMPSDLFRKKISEISEYIFSNLINALLNEIQTSTINFLSKKLEIEQENRVICIIAKEIMSNVSGPFQLSFTNEIKSNFIHSIKPKVERMTISLNHLT